MKNNEFIENKESFISKIKNSFKRNFEKNEENYNYIQEESINELKKDNYIQNNFCNNLKVNAKAKATNLVIERNLFLKEIEGNKEKLEMLSIDRLKKLEKYYNNIIEENDEKIKKLKKKNM